MAARSKRALSRRTSRSRRFQKSGWSRVRTLDMWLSMFSPLETRTLLSAVSLASFADPSFSSTSVSATGMSATASVSHDGFSVVYLSTATNLVAGQIDGNGPTSRDVVLFDTNAGSNTLISHADSDSATGANGDSSAAVVSADGQWVVFVSTATNLVPGQTDASGTSDVFLYNVFSGQTTLVSHVPGSPTTAGNGSSFTPVISGNDEFIAYATSATNLVSGVSDTNGLTDVVLYNTQTDTAALVSRSAADAAIASDGPSMEPTLSDDGRYVAYLSVSSNLVTGQQETGGAADVFLFDSQASGVPTQLLSGALGSATTAGNGNADASRPPVMSSTGRYIAYASTSTNLLAGQTDSPGTNDLFIYDTQATGTKIKLVSHAATSSSTAVGGDRPSMSASGQFIAYQSVASNLMAGQIDTNNDRDVFLYNTASATSTLVSHKAGNTKTAGNTRAGNPIICSGDSLIAYSSSSSDLIAGQVDTNGGSDVFRFDRISGVTDLVSRIPGSDVAAGNGPAGVDGISEDGTIVAFEGLATNLVAGDQNNTSDVFVWNEGGTPPSAPILGVYGNNTLIADNDFSPSPIDLTDFGKVALGSTLTRTFQIQNSGDSDLTLTGSPLVTISDTASAFTVISQPSATIPAGGSITFQIRYHPTKRTLQKATVQLSSDDGQSATFAIQATPTIPQATITGGDKNVVILDHATAGSLTNGTDFGIVAVGGSISHTFTIANPGTATLLLRGSPQVQFSGAAGGDFSAQLSNDGVAPGGSVTLTITFTPHGGGSRQATVDIPTNDPLENPFEFVVTGTATGVGFARGIGGTGADVGNAVTVDSAGNSYITGAMSGTVQFLSGTGGALTSNGGTDIFVAKYDFTGRLLWADRFGAGGDDSGNAIALDSTGNVLVAGSFQNNPNFSTGKGSNVLISAGGKDAFILKLDPKTGSVIFARAVGGTGDDIASAITGGPGGTIAVGGSFQGTGDFNPGANVFNLTSNGGTDAFVLQLDSQGNHIWSRSVGGGGDDNATGLAYDSNGNLFITGQVAGTIATGDAIDFDPGAGVSIRTVTNHGPDVYLWKLTSVGSLGWADVFNAVNGDGPASIAVAGSRVMINGSFQHPAIFDINASDPLAGSTGTRNAAFIAVYQTSDGSPIWARQIAGDNIDGDIVGRGIVPTPDGGIVTVGSFSGHADMDPGAADVSFDSGNVVSNIYISKLDQNGNYVFAQMLATDAAEAIARGIAVDSVGRPIVVGAFEQSVSMNLGDGTASLTSSGDTDALLWKFLPLPLASVHGNGQNILVGDAASALSGTDFGATSFGAALISHTFTVTNTGFSPIALGPISVPAGFSVTVPLLTSLDPGQSDTFTVTLNTSKAGLFGGEVNFATGNPAQNPFHFTVVGHILPNASFTTADIGDALDLPASAYASISTSADPASIIKLTSTAAGGMLGFPTGTDSDFLVVSTGVASDFKSLTHSVNGYQGTDLGTAGTSNDTQTISFDLPISNPTQRQLLKFDYMFLTQNYQASKNNNQNDFFKVTVRFDSGSPIDAALDTADNAITVDNGAFTNLSPANTYFSAATGLLTSSLLVPNGAATAHITIQIGDGGDGLLDSAAILDNFHFEPTQTVFLNYNGHPNFTYSGVTANVPAFSVTDVGWSSTVSAATVESIITTEVQNLFAGYNINIVTTAPTDGSPYTEVALGGDGTEGFFPIVKNYILFGQSDAVDYLNTNKSNKIILNTANFVTFYTSANAAPYRTNNPNLITQTLAVTIAHEIGHAVGLLHLDNANTSDPMKQNAPLFFGAAFQNLELTLAQHLDRTENTARYLANILDLSGAPTTPGVVQHNITISGDSVIFSSNVTLFNVTLGTIPNDSDADVAPQIFTFPVLNGATALTLPNLSGTDKFFLLASSKAGGPTDVTTGHLGSNGQPDIFDAATDFTDDQGNTLDSVNLFRASKGKLALFASAAVAPNPYSPAVKYLTGGKGTFTDSDGDVYTITLAGGGTVGFVMNAPDGDGKGSIGQLLLQNTTAKSTLSITVKKAAAGDGMVTIGSITGSGLKSIAASASDLVGDGINLTGFLGSLVIRDIKNGADIIAGGVPALKTTLTARKISSGTSIQIAASIASLTADAIAAADIKAPSLAKLTTKADAKVTGGDGSFAANITLSGGRAISAPLGTVSIGGAITGGAWNITGGGTSITATSATGLSVALSGTLSTGLTINGNASNLRFNAAGAKALTVKGNVTNSSFKTGGSIATVSVGSIADSLIWAGAAPGLNALPATISGFANRTAAIGVFTITGNPPGGTATFQRSIVAAPTLGKIVLKGIDPGNAGTDFGFGALAVSSYSRTGQPTLTNPTVGDHDRVTNYVLRIIARS